VTRWISFFPTTFCVSKGKRLQLLWTAWDGVLPMEGVSIRVTGIAVVLGLKGR
jgi:hypothetical protein